jgi:hypothetical protein
VKPNLIIRAVRARGSDARDLRDAAHEACHAIEADAHSWERESIHRAVRRDLDMYRAEVNARAVEQIVCRRLGVAIETVRHWAFICGMESIKFGYGFPHPEVIALDVACAMGSDEAWSLADDVCALAAEVPA